MKACNLVKPCTGRIRGFAATARQRLLLGLHPSSRVPLGADTVPEPGWSLPDGFTRAVEMAETSATSPHEVPCRGATGDVSRGAAVLKTARMVALRARVVAREALAKRALGATPADAGILVAMRRRLWGKQPPEAPCVAWTTSHETGLRPDHVVTRLHSFLPRRQCRQHYFRGKRGKLCEACQSKDRRESCGISFKQAILEVRGTCSRDGYAYCRTCSSSRP